MSQQLPEAAAELLRTPLTVTQRLELIGELWDSIPDSVEALPIPDWHRDELERRLAAADADPEAAIPWEEVKRRLSNRLICASLLILIPVIGLSQQQQAPGDKEREAICQQVPCRAPTTVKLRLNAKEYAEFQFPKGPYVAEGFINVLNGEEFNVEFEDQNGKLTNPRYVKEVIHQERTISIKLGQLENGTVLTVKNSFLQPLVYDCAIQHYQQQNFTRTSIVPVPAKLVSFESWPYPITQLVISNVRYQSSKTN